jgi:hypothetical protein
LLQPVYDGFTEGRDTKDVKDARLLLAELRVPSAAPPSVSPGKKPNARRSKPHDRREAKWREA